MDRMNSGVRVIDSPQTPVAGESPHGSPPRPFPPAPPGRLNYAARPKSALLAAHEPKKATSTYRAFRGFELPPEPKPTRLLTREERKKQSINNNLRNAIFHSAEPQSPVTRRLLKDSEHAENPERPKLGKLAGYSAHYTAMAKLRPESPWSEYNTRGGRIQPKQKEEATLTVSELEKMLEGDKNELAGPQIRPSVAVPSGWSKVDVIRTLPMPAEKAEEIRREQELAEAENEWKDMRRRIFGLPEPAAKQGKTESRADTGDSHQTSMRGQPGKYGDMYTCGTSRCCAKFGNCDPTLCVHIITDGCEGHMRAATNGTRLHTVTVHYEDENGNRKIHKETHMHLETETCDHHSCVHIHLPKKVQARPKDSAPCPPCR